MRRRLALVTVIPLVLASSACAGTNGNPEPEGTPDSSESAAETPDQTDPYPEKNVDWIVPFAAGGGADASFRVFQKYASPLADATIVINNIEGAGGVTGWTQLVNAEPDGYTLTLTTPPFNIIPKIVYPSETPYELDQFKYICTFASSANALFMKVGETRFTDLEGLVEYAKAHPKSLTAGTTGAVGTDTFHMYQFQDATGVELTLVPFDSGADSAAALSGGQVDLVFTDVSWVSLGEGSMQPLAIATAERHAEFPEIPTYTESGYDIIGVRLRAPAAPPETPDNVIAYWQDICEQVTQDPEFQDAIAAVGQPAQFLTGAETTDLVNKMAGDMQKIADAQGLSG